MASTSKAFEIVCGSVSSLFDTRWHTRSLRLLFGRRARTRCLWGGNLRALWAVLYEKAPFSSVPLFEERGAAVCFPRFGTHRCRGTEAIEIAGFAVGYGRWVREGPPLFACVGRKREWAAGLWWCDLLTSSDSAVSALLGYAQEEQEMFEGEEVETELHCIWMSFWRLWIIKINLSGHKSPARASLPFFINLDVEVEKEWKKLFFSYS